MIERKDLISDFASIGADELLDAAQDFKGKGYRLGQSCATKIPDGIEVLYSFERDNVIKNLKVTIDDKAPELRSVSAVYGYAFMYENEMHDLFGIKFKDLSLDYGGKFFKIAMETPWNPALVKGGDE
ncbi:MAG: NADH-quinone oxidoreductase subunit C [Clostridiales Family XIII bacterium]|jgi:ech hydrogenase subunit D|nr:NADH-quinone oxidoreductase subunit C [Clostridiales Family XIII bacterium]